MVWRRADGGVIIGLCVAAGLVRFFLDGWSIVCCFGQVRDVLGEGVEMFMWDDVGWVSSWVMFCYSTFYSSYKWSYQLWRLRSASTSKDRLSALQP